MPKIYDTLKIEYNKCPPDCKLCEEACAKEKGEGVLGLSRIKTIHAPQVNFNGALTCVQCSHPRCLQICPAGAIEKSTEDGVVRIDESKCVGCGLCTVACPYGAIYYNSEALKSFKCDQCNGAPKCVEACPYEVLTYVKNLPIINYLQEDVMVSGTSACRGCQVELALRLALRVLGKNTIAFGTPGCAVAFMNGHGIEGNVSIAEYFCLLGNAASSMTGVYEYYKHIGRDVNLLAFVGDAASADIGFQALSGAAERGEKLIYICYDNEGYMNTGVQRSSTTPFGARTYTSPVGEARHGKEQVSKYMPLLMLFHGIPYAATAVAAYPEDYAQKLIKASQVKDGLAYIHLFTPCHVGWGVPEDQGIDVSRMAVETNYFPLWEAENGKVRMTYEVAKPKPVREYLSMQGKYSHLTAEQLDRIQQIANNRYKLIHDLASYDIMCKA